MWKKIKESWNEGVGYVRVGNKTIYLANKHLWYLAGGMLLVILL